MTVTSIVIPAHNEAHVIGRLLRCLLPAHETGGEEEEFDIVVVANGCTDDTADVAATFGPQIRVLDIPVASKREALAAGNRAVRSFPRLYVDADVELGPEDVREMAAVLRRPGVLGAAPRPHHVMNGRPWSVRWYYDVWEKLPEVRRGLFGRGVVGVSEAGYARLAALPAVIADDLAASLLFSPEERVIAAGAQVVIHPPKTFSDLLKTRVRAVMGTNQIEEIGVAPESMARTRVGHLLNIATDNPRRIPSVFLFLSVALISRHRAKRVTRRSGYTEWLRDNSSRLAEPLPPAGLGADQGNSTANTI
ncbi:MAG: glycosyltransferase [Streptosporangiaceae bacterium]